ncbi:hypothetical protein NLO83_25375 [Pseudomonas tremae]|uniref:hypothetical protein n=1 Tax=Pseudomonas syringae group TaxID=136849 RepID=UPI0001AF6020|nr:MULTISPECIES: hypothetical protein [Pseudomonas syringae group]MCQ3018902.1 hypothetical protein [Pseudomonas tremae]QGL57413.1 hypothetical protein POR16_14220 [Pseudomonas coronafaciens pv. oryzae str. 1_6]RMM31901.1 hypothetical protein ALQ80_02063 [Pseudomonas coronafaciens pv. oryzae]
MSTELTEDEMRRALFGEIEPAERPITQPEPVILPKVVTTDHVKPIKKKIVAKAFTPRLRVTMRVGNEFEGKMHELIYEADTMSSLLAEQEATKAAKKKFRYVEVLSVISM